MILFIIKSIIQNKQLYKERKKISGCLGQWVRHILEYGCSEFWNNVLCSKYYMSLTNRNMKLL